MGGHSVNCKVTIQGLVVVFILGLPPRIPGLQTLPFFLVLSRVDTWPTWFSSGLGNRERCSPRYLVSLQDVTRVRSGTKNGREKECEQMIFM